MRVRALLLTLAFPGAQNLPIDAEPSIDGDWVRTGPGDFDEHTVWRGAGMDRRTSRASRRTPRGRVDHRDRNIFAATRACSLPGGAVVGATGGRRTIRAKPA